MRNLASVQLIKDIRPIEGADKIEVCDILGWHCVIAKKDNFKIDDKVVYIEVDSIVPEKPEFEFLRDRKFIVKTIKLRGQISQGLVIPFSFLPKGNYNVGDDVTEVLGITKYEPDEFNVIPVISKSNAGWRQYVPHYVKDFIFKISPALGRALFTVKMRKYNWPSFIPKTDETRVQVLQKLLTEEKGKIYYGTEKIDGSSTTYYYNKGTFGVCTRSMGVKIEGNTQGGIVGALVKFVKDNNVEKKLTDWCVKNSRNIALQGELHGNGIQGNKYALKGNDVRYFSVYDIDNQRYLPIKEELKIVEELGLKFVPIVYKDFILIDDIDELVKLAEGTSVLNPKTQREGIVWRPVEPRADGVHTSFKSINPNFLIKYND